MNNSRKVIRMLLSVSRRFLKLKINCDTTYSTYKSMLVADIVGELQFMEGHYFLHPLFACGWRVRMDVHSLWHFGVRLSRHHPPTSIKGGERRTEDSQLNGPFSAEEGEELTYCEICIGSRQPPQYQATECTWPLHPVRTPGTSSGGTFACGGAEEEEELI